MQISNLKTAIDLIKVHTCTRAFCGIFLLKKGKPINSCECVNTGFTINIFRFFVAPRNNPLTFLSFVTTFHTIFSVHLGHHFLSFNDFKIYEFLIKIGQVLSENMVKREDD